MGHTAIPDDIILLFVMHARDGTSADLGTLQSLSLTCKAFNRIMSSHHAHIIDHYTTMTQINRIIQYHLYGKLHRSNDQPAFIYSTKKYTGYHYYRHGISHRDNDLPSDIFSDGTMQWRQHGKLYRDNDKPAFIDEYDNHYWYQYDELHRDNDKPAIVWANGARHWFQHGKRHRDNGQPAIIRSNGTMDWYINGEHVVGGNL